MGARALATAGAIAALLSGCAGGLQRVQSPKRLQVVSTIVPITLLTKAVAGDCADVTPLISAQSDPHDVQARPADLVALQRAQVLVLNGLGMESFLGKLIRSAGNRQLRLIDSSRGVVPLANNTVAEHSAHDHHGTTAVNPHIWLDPRRAMQQVQTIRDGLIQADPGCADGYRNRAEVASRTLGELDAALANRLRPVAGRTFVVSHDYAAYFAQRYGLKTLAIVALPEQNPTPRQLARVLAAVQGTNFGALMVSSQQSAPSLRALARDLGVGVSVFDPLETTQNPQQVDLALYRDVMLANASQLIEAFKLADQQRRSKP